MINSNFNFEKSIYAQFLKVLAFSTDGKEGFEWYEPTGLDCQDFNA